MKPSKRTPSTKGLRKVIETSSIIPGNDMFDIIDQHFTRKAVRAATVKEIVESFGPATRELISELRGGRQWVKSLEKNIETLQQLVKDREDLLKQMNKKSPEADEIRMEIKKHQDEIKGLKLKLLGTEALFEVSTLLNKIYEGME